MSKRNESLEPQAGDFQAWLAAHQQKSTSMQAQGLKKELRSQTLSTRKLRGQELRIQTVEPGIAEPEVKALDHDEFAQHLPAGPGLKNPEPVSLSRKLWQNCKMLMHAACISAGVTAFALYKLQEILRCDFAWTVYGWTFLGLLIPALGLILWDRRMRSH